MASKSAPLGVIIIAVLMILGGILNILSGLNMSILTPYMPPHVVGLGAAYAAFAVLWGIISIIAAISLLKLRYWAWLFVVIVNIISLVLGAISFNAISFVITLIIIVYMFYRRDLFS